MKMTFRRSLACAPPLLALLANGALPEIGAAQSAASAVLSKPEPWLYAGSDIPADPAWTFGKLPNGVRYAVRKNGVPPGQVSIRIGIEAGSMMEGTTELGYAHFLEHLSFRGSRYVTDGEAKRVWQRLGATFGSDTNATTSTTQTVYKLDLPAVSPTGLDESLKILSGMMASPSITQAEVDAERRTVLAEAREQFGPEFEAGKTSRTLFFAGQLFGSRPPIGTIQSLGAATPVSLRAFHDRWYRPERAVIAIAGDVNPIVLEQLIKKYFSDWKGLGPSLPDPDFGRPVAQQSSTASVSAPGLPLAVSMVWLRPWFQKNDTIVYNQGKLVDLVALQVINRRLETAARAGASFLSAQVGQDDVSRSIDGTFMSVVPVGQDWQAAVRDVRAVIADALANPSTKDDILREAREFYSALQIGVETQRTEPGSKQADDILQAVDIRETVATAEVALDVFSGLKENITPQMILASTKRLFAGVGPRAVITSPALIAGADALLAQAISQPVTARIAGAGQKPVNIATLPKLGAPGKIISTKTLPELDLSIWGYANGINLLHFANPAEEGKIYVAVRFGRGMQALPSNRQTAAWAAPGALIASGIGPFGQNEIDRLASGRKINFEFETGEDAFVMRAQTRKADLNDQLRLMATKLSSPRWDAAPVQRAKAAVKIGYDSYAASTSGVLNRDLAGLLRGGDPRWTVPTPEVANTLTPKEFRSFWEPLLKTGPIEVLVFGDVTQDEAKAAVASTFGALKKRPGAPIVSPQMNGPKPTSQPILRYHKGQPDQAAAVVAWPTYGGIASSYESRKLDLLSLIFGDRMFDQLREAEGESYSPNVDSYWPTAFTGGGNFSVIAQLKPERILRFYTLTKAIAADLASKPPSADEIQRAVTPMKERITRASTGSSFWLRNLEGASTDPQRIAALKSVLIDYSRITPQDLQETARKWLKSDQMMQLTVLPEKK
jgi:zinc protease